MNKLNFNLVLISVFLLVSTKVFAFNIDDRVEYVGGKTSSSGRVIAIVSALDGQEILTVKLDGSGEEVQAHADQFKRLVIDVASNTFLLPTSFDAGFHFITS